MSGALFCNVNFTEFLFPSNQQKRDVRVSFPPFSCGKQSPLIGQAFNTTIPALLPWAAWPIRGRVVPHEVLAGNALTALFDTFIHKIDKDNQQIFPKDPCTHACTREVNIPARDARRNVSAHVYASCTRV